MQFIDFYPLKGMFYPGESVNFIVKIDVDAEREVEIHISITHLIDEIASINRIVHLEIGTNRIMIRWESPPLECCGYGARAMLRSDSEDVLNSLSTAFDVCADWTEFPRYGFLCDFYSERKDVQETVETLARYHINGLQFYDWQYRHDTLISRENDYIDPLGRPLALNTVRDFIDCAHSMGIAAMPYLAIYAASIEFWRSHQDWGLYDADGKPITFENFLGLMDPSPGSPWIQHLLKECDSVITDLPFNGFHVDQYGDPKVGFNVSGEEVDIPQSFKGFIASLKNTHPDFAVIFNAVANWPIDTLAASPQDIIYIELWPSTPRFKDITRIISNARQKTGEKPVVIALYLPVGQITNIRLVDALIFSSGGSRIEIGEKNRLLTDPYFPKHQPISKKLEIVLRRYYNFAVRYRELIGPSAEDLFDCKVIAPEGVWVTTRRCNNWLVVNLINFTGLNDPRWDEEQDVPKMVSDIQIQIKQSECIRQIWWASPDHENIPLRLMDFEVIENSIKVKFPFLEYWTMLVCEVD
jgi:dextranase